MLNDTPFHRLFPYFIILSILLFASVFIYRNVINTPPDQTQKIEKIIKTRTDTVFILDTILKTKIKRIEMAPDTVITHIFDSVFVDSGKNVGSDTIKTTIYAEFV
jgi:hypothetical protein